MPVSTRTYKDAAGTTKTRVVSENGSSQDAGGVLLLDENAAVLKGRKADALSVPIALSTENVALLQALLDAQPAAGIAATAAKQDAIVALLTTQATYLDGVEGLLGRLPSGGAASDAGLTSIDGHVDGLEGAIGTAADAAASSDTGTFSLIALFKRLLSKITTQLPAALGAGGGLKVDGSGTALPVSIATAPVLVAGSAIVGKVGIDQTTPGTTDSVSVATAQGAGVTIGATNGAAVITDANGTLQQYLRGLVKLWIAGLPAGTATIGNVGLVPTTSGGLSLYRNLDAGATGANPKASAGQLYGWYLYNNASAARYVKLYDKATAPTSGDAPVMTIPLPAGAAANVSFPNGIAFATGIGIRATTGVADADTGAPAANECVINLTYK